LEIKIREIMLQNPLVIQKDEPVKQAIDLMREHNVTGLPVLDGEKLFGVITLTDLRRHVTSQDLEKPTSLFCSVDLVTISPATTISDSLTMMHENQVGRLLVVSPSNPKKLLGIVSKKDLLELATRRYAQIDE
jgi:IMP dehydrogenase